MHLRRERRDTLDDVRLTEAGAQVVTPGDALLERTRRFVGGFGRPAVDRAHSRGLLSGDVSGVDGHSDLDHKAPALVGARR